jgi:tRNA U54 and U55 pseudouridine synthase Pus10
MSPVLVLPTDPATDRQRNTIAAMAAERGVTIAATRIATVGEASAVITELKAMAKVSRDEVAEPGFYLTTTALYRVRISRSGRTYAERLVVGDGRTTPTLWELAAGWQYRVSTRDAIESDYADELITTAFTATTKRKF